MISSWQSSDWTGQRRLAYHRIRVLDQLVFSHLLVALSFGEQVAQEILDGER